MASSIQRRRGTTSDHATFTGAVGEITIDTTKDTVVVHDGAVVGGVPLLREDGSNSSLALGSQGVPSLKFSGDPNTGIYSPGADQLAISTNGTGRLFVDASGNVGVNTASPSTYGKFAVVDTQDGFLSSTFVNTSNGVSAVNRIQIGNDGSNGAGQLVVYGSQHSTLANIFDVNNANPAALRLLTNNTERARIRSDGTFEIKGAGTAGSSPGFSVNPSTPANSFVIDSSGRLGIGTSDVRGALGLQHGNTSPQGLTDVAIDALRISQGVGGIVAIRTTQYDAGNQPAAGDTQFFNLYFNGSTYNYYERMRIRADGCVGIGTTPASGTTLHVDATGGATVRVSRISASAGAYGQLEHDGTNTTLTSTAATAFVNNGTEKARIRSDGMFEVKGAGVAGSSPAFSVSGSAPANSAIIDTSGRLLVGTSTARSNFFNTASSAPQQLQVEGTTGNTCSLSSICSVADTSGGRLLLAHQRSGAVNGNTILNSGDETGTITFHGNDGGEFVESASISAQVDGTATITAGSFVASRRYKIATVGTTDFTAIGASANTVGVIFTATGVGAGTGTATSEPYANSMPGRLVFSTTADGASSPTERMRITSAGLVGIGTTPSAWSSFTVLQVKNSSVASTGNDLNLMANAYYDGSNYRRIAASAVGRQYFNTDGSIAWFQSGSGSADSTVTFSTPMTLDSSGRLGIGTPSPAASLDVSGGSIKLRNASSGTNYGYEVNVNHTNGVSQKMLTARYMIENQSGSYIDIAGINAEMENADYNVYGMSFRIGASLTERVRIDGSGRLLVGTSTSAGTGAILQTRSDSFGAVNQENFYSAANATGPNVIFAKSRGSVGSPSVVSADDYLGIIRFRGHDGVDYDTSAAEITVQVDGTPGANDMPGRLVFSTTADGGNSPTERMRITSGGAVRIGSAISITPYDSLSSGTLSFEGSAGQLFSITNNLTTGSIFSVNDVSGIPSIDVNAAGTISLGAYGGNVGIGTSTPSSKLHVIGNLEVASANTDVFKIHRTGMAASGLSSSIAFQVTQTNAQSATLASITAEFMSNWGGDLIFSTKPANSTPNNTVTERMKITSGGNVLIGKTTAGIGNAGIELRAGNQDALFTNYGATAVFVNRTFNDGTLIDFLQDGTSEGNISVSGTTVSLNGAHLSRWSQLPSGAERTEILRGSVLSNLDEMCEWGEEDNEQLNRMTVSTVEGDKNVSGIFQCWDDDDDTYTNDFYCAMTGDFIIRIAAGITIERGDLLMSAGDGTAKPQDDDIIRSKTVAKVTSTNVSCTYEDGSYCVPCVLMAC